MRIAEVFRSIQGEGFLTGTPSVFVRTSGCNLRCRWCDTRYASWSPEGEELSVEKIGERVEELARLEQEGVGAVGHVVISGGEPMLFAELLPLCRRLHEREMHVTVETAGTLYLPVECDLMSISPKLSNSTPSVETDRDWAVRHEKNRHVPEVIRRLVGEYDYQVKFVVERPEDCREVEEYLGEFPEVERGRVMLMPQATNAEELARVAEWLRPYCTEHGLKYCGRRQIELFGGQRGR